MTSQLVELGRSECLDLLREHRVGRIAVVIDGQPHVVPVNYSADVDGSVMFRTGPHTVLTSVNMERVAFEIDGVDEVARSGWSVCIHGIGREVFDPDYASIPLRRNLTEPWAPGPRPRWFQIHPSEITGRRLEPSTAGDDSWFPGVPWS
jgi:nitroimidazol reductase NimA-like FMN-containing flavoprotein (pyridoxamine 5'-phosphate oxidase superfamily)